MTDQQTAPPAVADPDAGEPVDYYDVLVMRAILHTPARHRVNGWKLADATGIDVQDVRSITERLEGEGILYRFMGLRLTREAIDTFGTALWVCTGCGCTEEAACEGGCSWVGPELCSSCVPDHTTEGRP